MKKFSQEIKSHTRTCYTAPRSYCSGAFRKTNSWFVLAITTRLASLHSQRRSYLATTHVFKDSLHRGVPAKSMNNNTNSTNNNGWTATTCATTSSSSNYGESRSSSTNNNNNNNHNNNSHMFQNLGEKYAVKSDVIRQQARPDTGKDQREDRSFQQVLRVVDEMTGARPNRCPDNLAITNRLLDRLGIRSKMSKMRFVHVAGTKGKGTTSAYTAALLQGYGLKVGLFTSPHLTDIRERFLVDSAMLPHDTFARYFFELHDQYEALKYSDSHLDRDTASRSNYFRFLFMLSINIFAAENVDVAVMEVGLGGRIDATNTVPADVSIITALGYDHMDILGDTLKEITIEKAGILKPGVVCFASPQMDHPEVRKHLEEAARTVESPLIFLDAEVFPIRSWPQLAIGGGHAVEDSKLALWAARHVAGIPSVAPLDEVERSVLRSLTFAGRSQIVPVDGGRDCTFYLDGAHTEESFAHASKWFLEASSSSSGIEAGTADPSPPRRVLVLYTSRDPQRLLKALMPFVSKFCKVIIAQIHVAKITNRTPHGDDARRQQAHEDMVVTTECWRNLYREVPCLPCARPFDTLDDLLDLVIPAASDAEDASKPAHVLVTGSLYLVGAITTLLKDYEKMPRA